MDRLVHVRPRPGRLRRGAAPARGDVLRRGGRAEPDVAGSRLPPARRRSPRSGASPGAPQAVGHPPLRGDGVLGARGTGRRPAIRCRARRSGNAEASPPPAHRPSTAVPSCAGEVQGLDSVQHRRLAPPQARGGARTPIASRSRLRPHGRRCRPARASAWRERSPSQPSTSTVPLPLTDWRSSGHPAGLVPAPKLRSVMRWRPGASHSWWSCSPSFQVTPCRLAVGVGEVEAVVLVRVECRELAMQRAGVGCAQGVDHEQIPGSARSDAR